MILKLKPGIKAKNLELLRRALTRLLPDAVFSGGRNFIAVRTPSPELLSGRLAAIENLPGVTCAQLSISEACPRAFRAAPPDLDALFKKPGRRDFILIAGPCAVEDEASYLAAARKLKAAGAGALRAALFKPRTSPYAFQGLGAKGFGIIAKARRATGLAAVTEATSERQLAVIGKFCDIAQIGARNMRNYELLKAAARSGLPVMLKRAPGATLKEWLLSAEYLLKYGNGEILLCERGDSFSRPGRGLNLEMIRAAVKTTALPVIADPSHAAGDRAAVPAQALAAVKAGADGLLIEASLNPETALVDGRQTLSIPEFASLVKQIKNLLKNA
ncbi:MAG: N-acetylneuraminate synthase family protein [Elusimicrobiales bacterium]|jgi:3-deoxy-7-phosphoheptulonate synthase